MKSSDVEKIENIFKNLKCEKQKEVQEIFKDFNFSFSKKEKILLMIPGIDVFIIKKAAKRFYNNFKEKDKSFIKEKLSYIFNLKYNSFSIVFIILMFLLLSILYMEGVNPVTIFGSTLGILASSLSYFFFSYSVNKDMLEASKKDYLTERMVQDKYFENINNTINKEDFDKLKKYIDKDTLKKLLVDNDFNISYKDLKIFLDETKNKIEKDEKYLKAEEILLSKETVLL